MLIIDSNSKLGIAKIKIGKHFNFEILLSNGANYTFPNNEAVALYTDTSNSVLVSSSYKIKKSSFKKSCSYNLNDINEIKINFNNDGLAYLNFIGKDKYLDKANFKIENGSENKIVLHLKSNKLVVFYNNNTSSLNEPMLMYNINATFSPNSVVLNSNDTPNFKLDLIEGIRRGVKKSDWKQLIKYIGTTEKEFESVLPVSISSMQKKSVYSHETSERIYELAKLYALGYKVFDSKDDFKQWLKTPSKVLGNKIPFNLLDSSFGFELVENEITRIQYNVYS